MKEFIIPSFVKKIGDHIIRQCYSLEKVIFPPVIKIIEFCSNCTNLTEVSISSSVKTIDNRTFYECTSLSTIKIPSSVRSIGNYVFYKCKSLIILSLIKRTHANGMKFILDFVPNHVARQYHSISKPSNVKGLGEDEDKSVHFSPNNNFYYLPNQLVLPESLCSDWYEDENRRSIFRISSQRK